MEADQVIEGASSQVENRVATIADLQALMNSLREEIAFLCNPIKEPRTDLVTEEARQEIHSLQ
jgi:peptidoglycan hydrolase CwlO-like protein